VADINKIGEILIDAGVISRADLNIALDTQKVEGGSLGDILVNNHACSEEEVISAYGLQIGTRYVKISDFDVDPSVVSKIDLSLARKHHIFPIYIKGNKLMLAMVDPLETKVVDGVRFFLNLDVEPVIASKKEVNEAIDNYYNLSGTVRESEDGFDYDEEINHLQLSERGVVAGNYDRIIGDSFVMQNLFKNISKVASSNATVLLLGESGTGKELIAEAIHEASLRKDKPFIRISCAALPETLLESELFGHEKGAFTGAIKRRIGRFELANGGTLFLDEIGEVSLNIQVKLLRVLQQRMITRVGGMSSINIDVRIIAATNRDLEQAVKAGDFRKDFYYRLNVISFMIPPLRDRKEDIPALVDHFLEVYEAREFTSIKRMDSDVMEILKNYDWPGNVRELENCMERAVVMAEDRIINKNVLPYNLRDSVFRKQGEDLVAITGSLDNIEKRQVLAVLEKNNWSMKKSSDELGIHRNTLRRKMRLYGIGKFEEDDNEKA